MRAWGALATPIHTDEHPFRTDGSNARPQQFDIIVDVDGGQSITIQGSVEHYFTYSVRPPNEVLLGSDRAGSQSLHSCEAVVRYTLDGEQDGRTDDPRRRTAGQLSIAILRA